MGISRDRCWHLIASCYVWGKKKKTGKADDVRNGVRTRIGSHLLCLFCITEFLLSTLALSFRVLILKDLETGLLLAPRKTRVHEASVYNSCFACVIHQNTPRSACSRFQVPQRLKKKKKTNPTLGQGRQRVSRHSSSPSTSDVVCSVWRD